jgi:hypothetical protein
MTATNKRLLISESRGDLNRCTPCKGKSDQHDTYASRTSPCTFSVRFLRAALVRGNFSWVINRVGQSHCSWEKGLSRQSTSRRLTDPWVHTQFLSRANQWSNGESQNIYQQQATRLIGPISHACDRYVQYLLAGTNPSVLNRHRRGYNLGGAGLSHIHSPTFPTSCLHFPLRAPPGLQFNQALFTKPKSWV